MGKLSRRDFLKGAAALSTAGLLSACASNADTTTAAQNGGESQAPETTQSAAPESTMKWDYEADVVVVGTGTVITAAIAANEFGAESVIILEKSEFIFGGTSVTSGGGYALPGFLTDFADENNGDSREKCLSYMIACGEDRMNSEVMASFIDHSQEYVDWTRDVFGWVTWKHNNAHNDYYELYKDSICIGRGSAVPYDAEGNRIGAPKQWPIYQQYVESHDNMTLLMGTPAEALITENGRVIGVYAKQGDKTLAIKANKGVILGTGGFDHNEKMRRMYLPFPIYRTNAAVGNTGDAQRMGARIGAQLSMMDRVMGVPYVYDQTTWGEDDDRNYGIMASSQLADWATHAAFPHSLIVNRKGNRFTNEARQYDVFSRSFAAYDNGVMKFENIPAFFICDSQYTANFLMPGYATPATLPEFIFKYDTLEELAEGMGIDKEGLLDQVARFNANVKNGVDPEWHRGESEDTRLTLLSKGYAALPGCDLTQFDSLTGTLGTVEVGPFYCCRYVPGSCNTRGGLYVNGNSQVLDQDGEVIEGLYATGNCSTGVAGYWAGGACISQGAVMSYVAGKHVCGKA